jgi:hypothetical protein
MRILPALLAILFAGSVAAETIPATSRITAVTVYAQGADVTREVTFSAPEGSHQVVVRSLPVIEDGFPLRVDTAEGIALVSFAADEDLLPPAPPRDAKMLNDAEAAVATFEAAEAEALARIDTITARIEAADAKAGFLSALGSGDMALGAPTPDDLRGIVAMIGDEVVALRQDSSAAHVELRSEEAALGRLREDLNAARAVRDVLREDYDGQMRAVLSVVTARQGDHRVTVTYRVTEAAWGPFYDFRLDRKGGRLTIDRSVMLRQATGEDWRGVALTLSTGGRADQLSAITPYRDLRMIVDEALAASDSEEGVGGFAEPVMEPEVVAEYSPGAGVANYLGDTVVYGFPAVDVPTGDAALILALDRIETGATVFARATPEWSQAAYVTAMVTNTSAEMLLPGTGQMWLDGAMIGTESFVGLAPGAETELGFGPIETLQLRTETPRRSAGDRGLIARSNQIDETETLVIENTGAETWPVRLSGRVPYSEQEDLEITYTADPAPTETGVDGQRGILAWHFDIAPGERREIRVDTRLSWPEGFELR